MRVGGLGGMVKRGVIGRPTEPHRSEAASWRLESSGQRAEARGCDQAGHYPRQARQRRAGGAADWKKKTTHGANSFASSAEPETQIQTVRLTGVSSFIIPPPARTRQSEGRPRSLHPPTSGQDPLFPFSQFPHHRQTPSPFHPIPNFTSAKHVHPPSSSLSFPVPFFQSHCLSIRRPCPSAFALSSTTTLSFLYCLSRNALSTKVSPPFPLFVRPLHPPPPTPRQGRPLHCLDDILVGRITLVLLSLQSLGTHAESGTCFFTHLASRRCVERAGVT